MIAAVCLAWVPEPDAEVDVRLGQAELAEEHLRHPLVVVLAGVDQLLRDAQSVKRADHRCGLGEVRAGAGDVQDETGHTDLSIDAAAGPGLRRTRRLRSMPQTTVRHVGGCRAGTLSVPWAPVLSPRKLGSPSSPRTRSRRRRGTASFGTARRRTPAPCSKACCTDRATRTLRSPSRSPDSDKVLLGRSPTRVLVCRPVGAVRRTSDRRGGGVGGAATRSSGAARRLLGRVRRRARLRSRLRWLKELWRRTFPQRLPAWVGPVAGGASVSVMVSRDSDWIRITAGVGRIAVAPTWPARTRRRALWGSISS